MKSLSKSVKRNQRYYKSKGGTICGALSEHTVYINTFRLRLTARPIIDSTAHSELTLLSYYGPVTSKFALLANYIAQVSR